MPILKRFPSEKSPGLSLLSCFSKNNKSNLLEPFLLNGLGIVRRHIVSGAWDLDDLDEPSLEGRAPGSRQTAMPKQGHNLQSLLNYQHQMQGPRQDLLPSWIKKRTFLQVLFRVPGKPLRKRVSQAKVPGWGFLVFVCLFRGFLCRPVQQVFYYSLKASLNINRPSLRKKPHSKLPIGMEYLFVILVFEK